MHETLGNIQKPAAQTAHLFFAETKPKLKKQKSCFCQRSDKQLTKWILKNDN
jgi:hypothetical protein